MVRISPISVQEIKNIIPVQLLTCTCHQRAKKYQSSSCLPKDRHEDDITGTKSWKHFPISSSLQNDTLESFFYLKQMSFFMLFFSWCFRGFFFLVPLVPITDNSWSSVLWISMLYFYQQEAIFRTAILLCKDAKFFVEV